MGEFKLSDDLSEYPLDDNGEGIRQGDWCRRMEELICS